MENLGRLLCGHDQTGGLAKIALTQLSRSIVSFSERAIKYMGDATTEDAKSFGPFCARVLLENGCAALVGRLDSFRMLYLCEFQTKPEYLPGRRVKSAFSWLGDVIPDEKQASALWSAEHDWSKISRALFSPHIDHIYWRPAIEKMLDFASSQSNEPALAELLAIDAESHLNISKGKSLQLYSTLSKAVHWEFFSSALIFDENTVKSTIRDTVLLVSQLALASHFIPTAYASLAPNEALQNYIAIRKTLS